MINAEINRMLQDEENDLKATNKDTTKSIKAQAQELSKTMRCNCDLDNWQPDERTGHSWVCRIHRAVVGLPERY